VNPFEIISKYYNEDSELYRILINHSKLVAHKALEIAEKAGQFKPDLDFIEKAAMVHDIGIFLTDNPSISCFGGFPYLCHGYLGREILEREGFLDYGLVCERHVGVGISAEEIKRKGLPLPPRDMIPATVEEEIVCLADKFFSKKSKQEKPLGEIEKEIVKNGREKKDKLEELVKKFSIKGDLHLTR